MEVNAKIKELEEELKVLKAEIRNVLLDIREVILDKSNPLAEEHESAFIRMDLNTTARAMAAEAAAHEATKFADEAAEGSEEPDELATAGPPPKSHAAQDEELSEEAPAEDAGASVEFSGELSPDQVQDQEPDAEMPRVFKRTLGRPPESAFESEPLSESPEIPPMYMAHLPPLSGNGSLSEWLTEALAAVGPQELERVIAIHRLWGALPPNLSRALAYLQELLNSTQEARPPWLKVMQDLDRLASL